MLRRGLLFFDRRTIGLPDWPRLLAFAVLLWTAAVVLGGAAVVAAVRRVPWRRRPRPADTTFLAVEPEMSGTPRDDPGSSATIAFDGWLGDDLVRAYPMVLATGRLKTALLSLPNATGFRFSPVRVWRSPFLRRQHPGQRLPAFWAVEISGRPGRDDMGLTDAGDLVLSRRVLDVVLLFRVAQAAFSQYWPVQKSEREKPDSVADLQLPAES
jgi:hypothetical protein